jgi:hypothetical protein
VHVSTEFSLSIDNDNDNDNNDSNDVKEITTVSMESSSGSSGDGTSSEKQQQQQQQQVTRSKNKLPRSERKAMEREKKTRKKQQSKYKNNNNNNKEYNLHSTAVSQLTSASTADDVIRAIKRAQKMHDHHDLRVIANFLIDECDVGFAYGYRGSLLARLAVAALRWENHVVARRAVDVRRLEYRASMRPMESAAIIRGLLRTHNATDALEMLQDELSLPLEVCFLIWMTSGFSNCHYIL